MKELDALRKLELGVFTLINEKGQYGGPRKIKNGSSAMQNYLMK